MSELHPFLSTAWIDAARAIGETYRGRITPPAIPIRMNQIVTDTPDGADILAHLDNADGELAIELGHIPDAELTVTIDYPTARAIFVDGDAAAAMAAFLAGKIRVEGDVTRLLLLQAQTQQTDVDPLARELHDRIKAITAP